MDILKPVLVFGVFGAVAVLIMLGLIMSARANCNGFGEITGREVQYRYYGALGFDCFVRTDDGKWLPRGSLREVVGG